jgi:cyclic pyranopterin phosphate synthase
MSRHIKSGNLNELTLTTNGSQLHRFAEDLFCAGVRRINISIDTLNPEKFSQITRWGKLEKVLYGIDAALEAGLKVKINTVALRGFNENELFDLTDFCARRKMDLTFIEVMPMGDLGVEDRVGQYWALSDLKDKLETRYTLDDLPDRTGGPARYMKIKQTGQRIGLITPLTHNFCESCNRVRVTCTGEIYTCLGQEGSADLREPLRASETNIPLEAAIRLAIGAKPLGHDFDYSRGNEGGKMSRHMSHTGG